MAAYEEKTGGRVLALAHNGNLSNGIMFPEINPETGKPLTRGYAETRIRWEHTIAEFGEIEMWGWEQMAGGYAAV